MDKMDKVERYDWAAPGDAGKSRMVLDRDLNIDPAYQRDEVSIANTRALARTLRWDSFGVVVVFEREDGSLWVVDGQQRILALRLRGDFPARGIPARVFKSRGPAHEAEAFLAMNTGRKPVRAAEKYHAGVLSNHEPEREIDVWFRSIGIEVRRRAHNADVVDFPAIFMLTWMHDTANAKKAIEIQRRIVDDGPMRAMIHKGIWYLLRNGIDVGADVDRIKMNGGAIAIVHSIHAYQILLANSGKSFATCGGGLLSLLNKRRRNKLSLR